jgi:hypothetical protein
MEQLSKDFSLSEMTKSGTAARYGLSNAPTAVHICNLKNLCAACLQPIREIYGKPVFVSNGYRSLAVNNKMREVGYKTSFTSQHMLGEAADIQDNASRHENRELFDVIYKSGLYDQLIWEDGNDASPDWVHVSYKQTGNRRQAIRMKNGVTTHRKYDLKKWS